MMMAGASNWSFKIKAKLMNKVEYQALKKTASTQVGADDYDSLKYYAETQIKNTRYIKWIAIFMAVTSFPAIFIVIGLPIFIIALCLYFFVYRRLHRKALNFLNHVEQDPELTRWEPIT